jgi:exosortase family protein XrtF
MFLDNFKDAVFNVDSFTALVSNQTKTILDSFGFKVELVQHQTEEAVRILVNDKPIVRIVEGCNAMSVMILFAAFIVAFSGKFLRTTLYILFGLLLIHVLNILRISMLIVGILRFREYETLMHDIIFPLFIYGVVFAL